MHYSLICKSRKETGSVLVISLLFMVVLSLIGVFAMNTSTVEQDIAANDKFHKMAFYNADSGIFVVPKLIHECLMEYGENLPVIPGGILVPADNAAGWDIVGSGNGSFYERMMYVDADPLSLNPDIILDFEGNGIVDDTDTLIDVVRQGGSGSWARQKAGGGAEFSSAGRGIGRGGSGGSADIVYTFNSWGFALSNSQSLITAEYNKVPDVPGGL